VFTESKKDLKLFVNALLFSAVIPFLIALYQLLTGTGLAGTTIGFDSRLYGTFSHPNQFASFALIIFGLSWFYYQQKKDNNKTKLIPTIITLLLLIATFSRGAWLGIIIFSLIFGLLKNFKIIIFVFLFIIFMFLTSETVNKRISDLYDPPATSSIYWRIERWTENYQSFIQKPLLGHGSGTELVVYEKDHGFYSKNNYTHNDLIKNAIETGIMGTLSYLFLIFSTLFTLIKIHLKTESSFLKNFSLVVLSVFIALNAFSMTSNIFRGTATQWTLWFLIGACVGLYLKNSGDRKI
jgi:O-antigen ligase